MTKMKITSKFKLLLIISVAIIVIGMVVGTLGHFLMNGFFNYGDEFSSYKSVVVRYSSAEYTEDTAKPICDGVMKQLSGYTASYSQALDGGEFVYKFSANADSAKLQAAADKINAQLNANVTGDMTALNVASVREGTIKEGGSRALIFASIAVASAAAFMCLYYIFRYKLRGAITALFACVHNLGLFVALVALTRVPVGAELIAISALVVLVTTIGCGVFFGRVSKNFKNDAYVKTDRAEVIDISATESHKTNMATVIAIMAVSLVFAVFAAIASMTLPAIFIAPVVLMGMLACCYGTIYLIPAVYAKVDCLCEKMKQAKKEKKAESKTQPAVSDKAEA